MEKKVTWPEYIEFHKNYYRGDKKQRYGQAFCNKFYPEHSCMNGCTMERIYYATNDLIAQNLILDYIV